MSQGTQIIWTVKLTLSSLYFIRFYITRCSLAYLANLAVFSSQGIFREVFFVSEAKRKSRRDGGFDCHGKGGSSALCILKPQLSSLQMHQFHGH